MHRSILSVALLLLASGTVVGQDCKSGPQVGEGILGGFGTTFINGDHAGQRRCPV